MDKDIPFSKKLNVTGRNAESVDCMFCVDALTIYSNNTDMQSIYGQSTAP